MLLMVNDFLIATSILAVEQARGERRVIAPQLVLSAFILEIELKCLLKIRGISFPRKAGHNLKSLFHLLPTPDKDRIQQLHRDDAARHGRSVDEADTYFREALEVAQDDFVTIRYVYEKRGGHETKQLGPLFLAVYSYLFEVRPEWCEHQLDFGLSH